MPGRSEPGGQRGRLGRSLVLLVTASWLLLLVLLGMGVGAARVVAASPNPISPLDCGGLTCTPISTPTTPVATNTPTATATAAGTATPTRAASTATPTATTAAGGGGGGGQGGGGNGDNQSGGPQPTKVVLAYPTVGSGADSPLASLSPAAMSSNGLLLATSLSCVVAILGLIVAAVAIYVLINGGYGPFLRALVLGKRAGRTKKTGKGRGTRAAEMAYENGWDDGGWEQSGAYEFDGSAEYRAQPPRTQGRNGGGRNSGPRGNGSSGGYGGSRGYEDTQSGPRSGPQRRAPVRSTRNMRER